jgi:hypothetical protein
MTRSAFRPAWRAMENIRSRTETNSPICVSDAARPRVDPRSRAVVSERCPVGNRSFGVELAAFFAIDANLPGAEAWECGIAKPRIGDPEGSRANSSSQRAALQYQPGTSV